MCSLGSKDRTSNKKAGSKPTGEAVVDYLQRFGDYMAFETPIWAKASLALQLSLGFLPNFFQNERASFGVSASILILLGIFLVEFKRIEEDQLPARSWIVFLGPLIAMYGVLAYGLFSYFSPLW